MRLWRRRPAVEVAPLRLDVGQLCVDHRVTHAYEARPAPKYVTLQCRAADSGEMLGQFPVSYSGQLVRVPRWVLARAAEHGADELDIVVTW